MHRVRGIVGPDLESVGGLGDFGLSGAVGVRTLGFDEFWVPGHFPGQAVLPGVLVAEALSVILQVASYKLRKKRIFLCSPLHHHFQFKGWPETRVTARFWIAGAVLALASLATFARWPT